MRELQKRLKLACRRVGCVSPTVRGSAWCAEHKPPPRPDTAPPRPYIRREDSALYAGRWREISRLWRARNPICGACRQQLAVEVHHIVPLRDGGTHHHANLVGLCRECHEALERKATRARKQLTRREY